MEANYQSHFKTYYSNKAELLFEFFKEALFKGTSPLAKRIVIVPSRAMKSWLTIKLAEDKEIGIAAGIDILLIEPAIKKIFQVTSSSSSLKISGTEPSEIELTLALEFAIRNVCAEKYPKDTYEPLLDYIGISTDPSKLQSSPLPRKAKQKMIGLASVLAKSFIEYGIYGSRLIDSWKNSKNLGWQELLWFKIEEMFFPWNYPAKKLLDFSVDENIAPEMLQIHLFGISYLPPLYLKFLEKVSKKVPVNFYQQSPCQKFWGDIVTPKESVKLLNFWKRKGASASNIESLEELILDSSPLLANFGKLGREMVNVMDEFSEIKFEQYAMPQSICAYPQYSPWLTEDILLEKTKHPLTLLEAVQADMALMKSPSQQDPIVFDTYDSSIQVHAAPKPRREVEVIYDVLLQILSNHHSKDPIEPSDILVMAPNMDIYLPYIRTVFQKGVLPLDIQLVEPSSLMEYEVAQGFLHLLNMATGRLEASQLLKLLSFPSFRKKQNIDSEAFRLMEKWIKEVKVFWGKDQKHKEALLNKEYPFKEIDDVSAEGTWESGFNQMLEGLIYNSKELSGDESHGIHPLESIEFSESPHLAKLLTLINSLCQDFKPLIDGSKLQLNEWIDYLKCLLEVYFSDTGEVLEKSGFQKLFLSLSSLKTKITKLDEAVFTFDTILSVVENFLQKESTVYKGSNLNAVKFSSLLPMRTVPAKVIVLMGLGDGLFPRETSVKTWNLMFGSSLSDYCPDHIDFDRFLILEALLSARKYLILSYTYGEPGNIRQVEPSQVVKELMHYLDQSYLIKSEKPSKFCKITHPLDSFDVKYFNQELAFKSFSLINYMASKAHSCPDKKPTYSFIEKFCPLAPSHKQNSSEQNGVISIELKKLLSFAKNPLKSFLNGQGIFVKGEKNSQDEAELFINDLNSWILVKEALKRPVKESLQLLIDKACKKGMLSHGSFLEVGKEKLRLEILAIEHHLKTLGINSLSVFSLKFNEKKSLKEDTADMAPPINLESKKFGRIKITGSFDFATPLGLIFLVKDDLKKAIELWPAILAFACLIKDYELPLKCQAIFIKHKECKVKPITFENCKELLTRFVDYYLNSLNSPTPLSPEYVQRLLNDKIAKKPLEQYSLTALGPEEAWGFQDPHARWLDHNSPTSEIATTVKYWKDSATDLYASIPATWYAGKSHGKDSHEDV